MSPDKQHVEDRLREDIKHLDEITLFASEILYELEKTLRQEGADIDAFQQEIESKFHFDETRLLLFRRAIARYKQALQFTNTGEHDPEVLLHRSHLDFPKYRGIHARFDPRYPGVLIIHLATLEDGKQFGRDTESENMKKLRKTFEQIQLQNGQRTEMTFVGDDRGHFIGKAANLTSLGLDPNLPLLGAIVLCDESEPEIRDGILTHEYAHALYASLLEPTIHRYFSGADVSGNKQNGKAFSQWLQHFSADTRIALFVALGDISTARRERILSKPEVTPDDASFLGRRASRYLSSVPPTSRSDELDYETRDTLLEEQTFLNEMRAYGFNMPILPATMPITSLKIEKPEYPSALGYVDPKIAKRFFELHIKVLKAYLLSSDLHIRVLSILGTAQTLDQANRLVGNLLENGQYAFGTQEQIEYFTRFALGLKSGQLDEYLSYSLSDNVVIPRDEVVRQLLPPREVFEEGLRRFYGENWPLEAQQVLQLY